MGSLSSVNGLVNIVSAESSTLHPGASLDCKELLRTLGDQLPNNQISCDETTVQPPIKKNLTNSLGVPTATITGSTRSTHTGEIIVTPLSHSHSGLSTGTEAGIGVAIAALVTISCVLIYIFLRRRRRTRLAPKHVHAEETHGNELPGEGPYNVAEAELENVQRIHEVDAGYKNWFPKLDSSRQSMNQTPVELPAGDDWR